MVLVDLSPTTTSSATLALGSIAIVTTARSPVTLINMVHIPTSAQLINHKVRAATLRLAVGTVHADVARRALAPVVVTGTLLDAEIFGCSAGYRPFAEDFGESIASFVGRAGLDCVADFEGFTEGGVLRLGESGSEERCEEEDG
jgi:hypothetical protein